MLKDKTISQKEAEVKKGDIQKTNTKNHCQGKTKYRSSNSSSRYNSQGRDAFRDFHYSEARKSRSSETNFAETLVGVLASISNNDFSNENMDPTTQTQHQASPFLRDRPSL